jgi:riboflavin kinase/FMN adenylyltransferase
MQVYRSVNEFPKLAKATVTSGTFDGVHLGHKKILKTLIDTAKASNSESVVITFWPHPRMVLQPDQNTKLLASLEEKIELIANEGPDHLIIIPFTRDFSNQSSEEFIKEVLVKKIGTKHLIIGYDHRFGKNREGSFEYLKNYSKDFGFSVIEIPREDIDHIGISSTLIRNSLRCGELEKATTLLGKPYFITGLVVHGEKIGRKLGFPTANIQLSETSKLLPQDGVYAVEVIWNNNTYQGMMNIGFRPTVEGSIHIMEVHLFDFTEDLYGEQLRVNFIKYIRSEKKFSSLDELKNQLSIDKQIVEEVLNS